MSVLDRMLSLEPAEIAAVEGHLRQRYASIFTEGAINDHLADYVGPTFAGNVIGALKSAVQAGASVLDIGCGFGSFVLVAREEGFDARGVELEPFEVAFARRRLAVLRPQDDPERVYTQGDARELADTGARFGAITMWNVLEHIDRADDVIATAARLLSSGGFLFVICPNYAAFRQEAHYHVPWPPLLPRAIASRYLRWLGRDPAFFESSIFYRTNWGVLRSLARAGLEPYDFYGTVSMVLGRKTAGRMIRSPRHVLAYFNPFRSSVVVAARKP